MIFDSLAVQAGIGLFVCGAAVVYQRWMESLQFAQSPPNGDEDIKIVTGSFSGTHRLEDAGDTEAQEFLHQKELGNIEQARELGIRYAQAILELDAGPLAKEIQGKAPLVQHHQYLLYSHLVSRMIAEESPNSILAQTSLNVFYNAIEDRSGDMHKHLCDMAGLSLYILCERSHQHSSSEIGAVFAQLCGKPGDADWAAYGKQLCETLDLFCRNEIEQIKWNRQ